MPDQELVCRDCGAAFTFTEAEQAYFQAQGFTNPPKRCKACRAKARHRGAPQGNGPRAPARPAERPAPEPPRAPVPRAPRPPRGPLHTAVCSLCATATEVPFVPDGVRPVYCLPCLKKQTR